MGARDTVKAVRACCFFFVCLFALPFIVHGLGPDGAVVTWLAQLLMIVCSYSKAEGKKIKMIFRADALGGCIFGVWLQTG